MGNSIGPKWVNVDPIVTTEDDNFVFFDVQVKKVMTLYQHMKWNHMTSADDPHEISSHMISFENVVCCKFFASLRFYLILSLVLRCNVNLFFLLLPPISHLYMSKVMLNYDQLIQVITNIEDLTWALMFYWMYQTSWRKEIKMRGLSLINSIIQEHECYILLITYDINIS